MKKTLIALCLLTMMLPSAAFAYCRTCASTQQFKRSCAGNWQSSPPACTDTGVGVGNGYCGVNASCVKWCSTYPTEAQRRTCNATSACGNNCEKDLYTANTCTMHGLCT